MRKKTSLIVQDVLLVNGTYSYAFKKILTRVHSEKTNKNNQMVQLTNNRNYPQF